MLSDPGGPLPPGQICHPSFRLLNIVAGHMVIPSPLTGEAGGGVRFRCTRSKAAPCAPRGDPGSIGVVGLVAIEQAHERGEVERGLSGIARELGPGALGLVLGHGL